MSRKLIKLPMWVHRLWLAVISGIVVLLAMSVTVVVGTLLLMTLVVTVCTVGAVVSPPYILMSGITGSLVGAIYLYATVKRTIRERRRRKAFMESERTEP